MAQKAAARSLLWAIEDVFLMRQRKGSTQHQSQRLLQFAYWHLTILLENIFFPIQYSEYVTDTISKCSWWLTPDLQSDLHVS